MSVCKNCEYYCKHNDSCYTYNKCLFKKVEYSDDLIQDFSWIEDKSKSLLLLQGNDYPLSVWDSELQGYTKEFAEETGLIIFETKEEKRDYHENYMVKKKWFTDRNSKLENLEISPNDILKGFYKSKNGAYLGLYERKNYVGKNIRKREGDSNNY